MDGDLGPISPICRSGAPAVSCCSRTTCSRPACSAACCAVAAKEAARASVAAIIIMDEGELHTAARADPCAHSRISFIRASSATRLRCLHFSHSFLPTTRELTLPCIDMLAEACWQVGKSSASRCLPPRSTARCAHRRCGHRIQDGRDLLHAGPPSGAPERLY